MADYKLIGHNYQTPDIVAKVTGRAKYAEDYRADGMLFVKLLLSPMPHARVRNIDASEALKMPGVHAILTADDVPVVGPPAHSHAQPGGPHSTRATDLQINSCDNNLDSYRRSTISLLAVPAIRITPR